jgi:PAS domain S-box-containing protein
MDKTQKEILKELQELQQENKSLKLALESEITKRQDLLLQSEERYRNLVDNALVGVYEISLDGSIIYGNDAMKKIMELDCYDLTSLNVITFYKDPRDRERLINKLKDKSEVRNFETTLVSCKGNPREVIVNARLDGDLLKGMLLDITDLKRLEQQIRLEKEHIDAMLTSSTVMIYSCEAFGDFDATYVSENIISITGWSCEDFLSKGFWANNVHPEDVPIIFNNIGKLFENNYHQHEYRFRFKDGYYHWMLDELKLVRDEKGDPKEIRGTWSEINSRKLTEEKLRASLSLNEATLESIHNGILVVNQQGLIVKTNNKFAELWQIPAEVINSGDDQTLLNYVIGQLEDTDEFISKVEELYKNPESESFDLIYFKDGRIFDRISKPIYLDGIPKGRVWSFLDITDHKRSDERYRLLADHMNNMVWLMDLDLNVIYQSPSSERMRGFTLQEFQALTLEKNLAPDSLKMAINLFQKELPKILANSDYNPVYSFELEYYRKDGSTFWSDTKFSFIRNEKGIPISIIGEGRDITERKRAVEEINKLNAELEQRVAERTEQLSIINRQLNTHIKEIEQLTYITTHDLQEPVRTMTSFSELLKQEYSDKLDEDGNKYVDFIFTSATRMGSLVKGLLDYSLLGQKKIISIVDCNKLLQEVISDLSESVHLSGAKITVQELPGLNGMSLELRLLFQNLLQNAIKFRKKDVPPEISVSAERKKHEWVFAVEDNGIGIEKRLKERIFIIFQRAHHRSNYDGNGIGLAFCKKIVELHGGRIWVESTPGTGSIFKFTIATDLSLRQL